MRFVSTSEIDYTPFEMKVNPFFKKIDYFFRGSADVRKNAEK